MTDVSSDSINAAHSLLCTVPFTTNFTRLLASEEHQFVRTLPRIDIVNSRTQTRALQ